MKINSKDFLIGNKELICRAFLAFDKLEFSVEKEVDLFLVFLKDTLFSKDTYFTFKIEKEEDFIKKEILKEAMIFGVWNINHSLTLMHQLNNKDFIPQLTKEDKETSFRGTIDFKLFINFIKPNIFLDPRVKNWPPFSKDCKIAFAKYEQAKEPFRRELKNAKALEIIAKILNSACDEFITTIKNFLFKNVFTREEIINFKKIHSIETPFELLLNDYLAKMSLRIYEIANEVSTYSLDTEFGKILDEYNITPKEFEEQQFIESIKKIQRKQAFDKGKIFAEENLNVDKRIFAEEKFNETKSKESLKPKTNKLAQIGSILGAFSIIFFSTGVVPILALILSSIGWYQAKKNNQGEQQRIASVGIMLGIIFTIIFIIIFISE